MEYVSSSIVDIWKSVIWSIPSRASINNQPIQIRTYDAKRGFTSLVTIPTSQASAIQRAGRAGRTSGGICYRLYPESVYNSLSPTLPPDITRVDLSAAIVQLKALGINQLTKVDWLTIPPSSNLSCALDMLIQSEIVNKDGHLTMLGHKVAEVPLEVGTAKLV